MNRFLALLAILILSSLTAFAQAGRLAFSRVNAQGTLPAGRQDGPIVYDAPARRLLMFGGLDNGPRNDLWAFSLDRQEWTELNPSGTRPPARFGHTAVFDPVRRRVVVFGGQAGGFFSDVWAYDIAQNAWRQLSPDNAGPSRRYAHSAIYEVARDRMVISHGFTDQGRFDDTWAFNLANNTWQNISPPSGRPLRRCLHHAVHDARNSQMLLFGGCASGFGPCPLDDLWSFDLNSNQWTERAVVPRPSPRQHYGMAFDAARNRLVLFGGSGSGGNLNDTWEYDPAANSWTQTTPAGEPPSGRSRHEAAFVADLGATFFFGGATNTGLSNELWMLFAPVSGVVNAAHFLPGPLSPGQIVSVFGANLASSALAASSVPLPTTLGGASTTVGGVRAPLFYASPTQINLQVPWELAGQTQAALIVSTASGASGTVNVTLASYAPGLFATNQRGSGQGAILISGTGALAAPRGASPGSRPALRGEFIEIFAIGLGPVSNRPASGAAALRNPLSSTNATPVVTIGGVAATVSFSGLAPDFVGLYQVNVQVPANAPVGDTVQVLLTVGNVASNPVTIAIQ